MALLSIISSDLYENGYESGVWNDVFCDEVPGIPAKQVRALLVTLSKKNFINLGEEYFEVTGKFQDFIEAFQSVGIKGDDYGRFNRESCEVAKDIVSTIAENLEKAKTKKTQAPKAETPVETVPEVKSEPAAEEIKTEPKNTKSTKKTKTVTEEKTEEPADTTASNTVTLKAFTGMTIGKFNIAQGRENTYLQGSKRSDKIAKSDVTEWYKVTGSGTPVNQITEISNFNVKGGDVLTVTLRAHSSYFDN